MQCLLSARYVLKADILRQSEGTPTVPLSEIGEWTYVQDPDTLELVPNWVPVSDDVTDPDAPTVYSIPCMASGIIDGGIRVAGTTERFDQDYRSMDYVRMLFPADIILTQRDRVTNIRNAKTGQIVWRDEQVSAVNAEFRATVFDVDGVTPILNPFGRHIENFANLKKSAAA